MKNLLLATLTVLLFACTREHVMQADLRIVGDRDLQRLQTFKKYYKVNKDSVIDEFSKRLISLHYSSINVSGDTMFIPIGYPLDIHPLTAYIESHDSLKTLIWRDGCYKRHGHSSKPLYFAPGDTIDISFLLLIESTNRPDLEWLQIKSTKELVSKIHINMVKPTEGKDLDKIPRIIFNNDTNDICINPIINANERKVVCDK